MTVLDRSQGHTLVYNLATGNGGYNGSHVLYELYLRTLDSVTLGRRRPTERERHQRVVKPLAGSIFKYLDQIHADKGGTPGLKVCRLPLKVFYLLVDATDFDSGTYNFCPKFS